MCGIPQPVGNGKMADGPCEFLQRLSDANLGHCKNFQWHNLATFGPCKNLQWHKVASDTPCKNRQRPKVATLPSCGNRQRHNLATDERCEFPQPPAANFPGVRLASLHPFPLHSGKLSSPITVAPPTCLRVWLLKIRSSPGVEKKNKTQAHRAPGGSHTVWCLAAIAVRRKTRFFKLKPCNISLDEGKLCRPYGSACPGVGVSVFVVTLRESPVAAVLTKIITK